MTYLKSDVMEMKAKVLYLLNKCGGMDTPRLYIMLYFAQREMYAKYAQGMIYDVFLAKDGYPEPEFLSKSLHSFLYKDDELLCIIPNALEINYGTGFLIPKEEADKDELSVAAGKILDEVYEKYSKMDIIDLAESSMDEAWKDGRENDIDLHIDNGMIAKMGGASDKLIEYIKENELFSEYLKG